MGATHVTVLIPESGAPGTDVGRALSRRYRRARFPRSPPAPGSHRPRPQRPTVLRTRGRPRDQDGHHDRGHRMHGRDRRRHDHLRRGRGRTDSRRDGLGVRRHRSRSAESATQTPACRAVEARREPTMIPRPFRTLRLSILRHGSTGSPTGLRTPQSRGASTPQFVEPAMCRACGVLSLSKDRNEPRCHLGLRTPTLRPFDKLRVPPVGKQSGVRGGNGIDGAKTENRGGSTFASA